MYTQKIVDKAVAIAVQAAKAHQVGKSNITINDVEFDLGEGGMCLRFVDRCWVAATGEDWEYGAPMAKMALTLLGEAGKKIDVDELLPGDIVGISTGTYGHIALYIGDGNVAENTSANNRGNPRVKGTKITPYSDLEDRVTGIYRLLEVQKIKVIKLPDIVLSSRAQVINDEIWVPIRDLANTLNWKITDHIADQGKIYIGGIK